jgi:hypothetical protein
MPYCGYWALDDAKAEAQDRRGRSATKRICALIFEPWNPMIYDEACTAARPSGRVRRLGQQKPNEPWKALSLQKPVFLLTESWSFSSHISVDVRCNVQLLATYWNCIFGCPLAQTTRAC